MASVGFVRVFTSTGRAGEHASKCKNPACLDDGTIQPGQPYVLLTNKYRGQEGKYRYRKYHLDCFSAYCLWKSKRSRERTWKRGPNRLASLSTDQKVKRRRLVQMMHYWSERLIGTTDPQLMMDYYHKREACDRQIAELGGVKLSRPGKWKPEKAAALAAQLTLCRSILKGMNK